MPRKGDDDYGDDAVSSARAEDSQMAKAIRAGRQPNSSDRRRRRHRQRGHAIGVSQATYNASQAQVSSLKSQVSGLQTQVSNDNASVAIATHNAATAQQTANANAAAAYKGKEAASATYQSKEATLAATQQTANQEAATLKQELGQVQANTINGDGTYVVGQDIKGGTYHTNGSGTPARTTATTPR